MACRGCISPEKLPPSERAAHYHGLRVHLQVVQWSLSEIYELDALLWGWKSKDSTWLPITTDLDFAPGPLKQIIRCKCKMSSKNPCSTKICTCRKNGLPCLPSCTGCRGEECSNCEVSYVLYWNVYICGVSFA